MTQLSLFGDQPTQKPAKKPKRPKATYSSPTIVIIDRRTNINFNVAFFKVSLISVALCLTPSSSVPNIPAPKCIEVGANTQWPALLCPPH